MDVTENPGALEFIKGLGYLQAPVVYTSGPIDEETESWHTLHWSGYQPDAIAAIIK